MLDLLKQEPRARRFLAVHAQSSLGTGAAYIALLVLAYDRFRSPWAITLILLADFLPAMLLGPYLGALADRWSRRDAAVRADVLRAIAFAGLAAFGSFELTVVFALLVGTGTGLFRPAIMAALPSLVGPARTPALTASYGAIDHSGNTLGPALAAGALLVISPETLLLLNALTFAISALVLARLDFGPKVAVPAGQPGNTATLTAAVGEGLRVVARMPPVATVVFASSSIVLFAGLFNVGELLLATEELGADSSGFSVLVAVFGIGAVAGSLAGSRSVDTGVHRRRYVLGLACVGVGMLAAGLAPTYLVALATFLLAGIGNGLVVVHERLLLQADVPDSVMGRVFGFKDTLSSWAFGTAFLAAGAIASLIGIRELFLLAGAGGLIVCAAAAMSFMRSDTFRGMPAEPEPAGVPVSSRS